MAVRPDTTTKSSTPAPAKTEEDLEQYGVWVKAEPQDILEEPEVLPLGAAEFDLPSDSALPSADSFLTDDEEKLLGSFDELDTPRSEKSVDLQDIENLPPLQDFEIPEASADSDLEELGSSTIDISLDELESSSEDLQAFSPKAKFDLDREAAPKKSPAPAHDDGEMEDVSAEFLDFEEEEAKAQETADVTSEFLGEDEAPAAPAKAANPEPDFEAIDMDLSFDETPSQGKLEEPGFAAVSEFDDLLSDQPSAQEEAPLPSFDDLSAVENDLADDPVMEPAPSRAKAPSQAQASEPSLANELLLKIAEELSSIRGELVNLKGQFAAFKTEEKEAVAEEEETKAGSAGGFFDDEEDETIALTGDELDNIVNTADFIEENAEEGVSESLTGQDLMLEESLLPETGDYSQSQPEAAEVPGIEEIHLEANEDLVLPPQEEEGSVGFDLDEGVQPLTQAPEDTSYLEEPLPDEEPLELAEIPLHEESLAEEGAYPLDLESDDIEPIEEIAEELPVVEGLGKPGAVEEPLEDLTLDLTAEADYASESPVDLETHEALPEIEDIGFGELSLAEESPDEPKEDKPEELVELMMDEEDLSPIDSALMEEEDLEAKLAEKTVKPSQPVSLHPDEIAMSLDDSFFVGSPNKKPESLEIEDIDAVVPEAEVQPSPLPKASPAPAKAPQEADENDRLKTEIKDVLSYLDKLLESLPESKIEEFARSEHFDTYKRLFEELGLV